MAMAVKELYPEAKLAIGPSIDDGFYYDFDLKKTLTEEDLTEIASKMSELISKNIHFERIELSKDEAIKLMEKNGEKFKVEILHEISDKTVSLYKNGDFIDLCRGPHVGSTGEIKAFKLLSVAGAYWKGNEEYPMLQRIYGTAFFSDEELTTHITRLEEAIKRDHRKLGRELDLFNIYNDEAGAGFVYYHPKGTALRFAIEDFLRKEHIKRGYQQVITPNLAKINLWKQSGHAENYAENMYFLEKDKEQLVVKPMNCPGHILIYKNKLRSYRDLPIRFFELGTVYRYERSGVLHGLLRVRGFTQDDAHIFCTPAQLTEEINKVFQFASDMMKTFGFEFECDLSTRPEKYIGSEENWEMATSALKNALDSRGQKYEIDEGAGVFYGPKIDIKLKDAIGRLWQGPTIQVDFNLPERFDLHYIGEDGAKHRPVMIHRVVLGSMERFIGALIEHYAGSFPVWLAPIQVMIIPISDRHLDTARELGEKLIEESIRTEIDSRREKINLKIRDAQIQKIPYMAIIGDKEIESGTVSIRSCKKGDMGKIKVDAFLDSLRLEIKNRVYYNDNKGRDS